MGKSIASSTSEECRVDQQWVLLNGQMQSPGPNTASWVLALLGRGVTSPHPPSRGCETCVQALRGGALLPASRNQGSAHSWSLTRQVVVFVFSVLGKVEHFSIYQCLGLQLFSCAFENHSVPWSQMWDTHQNLN